MFLRTITADALKRSIYAFRLQRQLQLPILITGGLAKPGRESEAQITARILRSLGLDNKYIYTENNSRNTLENARFSRLIINKQQWQKIILVTSAFHMQRSVYAFTQAGIECTPAPTCYLTNRMGYGLRNFLPQMGVLFRSYRALREYMGLLYYKLRSV